MADFTLNAPGTDNNPWNPANIIIPSGSLQTSASLGIRNGTGVDEHVVFAHDADYGDIITSEIVISQFTNFDVVSVGAIVRSGANAGAGIVLRVRYNDTVRFSTLATNGDATDLSSDVATLTNVTAGDVFVTVYNKATGSFTATQNGATIGSGVTNSTYAGEASLAAGGHFFAGNTNSTYISAFSGTGVLSGGAATQLEFGNQPQNTVVGQTMAAVTVNATDSGSITDTSYTGNVTIALQTGSGTLAGTLTKAAVAGVATFDDLSINTLNTNAVLRATASGLTQDDSATFNITAGSGGSSITGSPIGSALVS